ncbi:MAG: hypothetical protein OEX08_00320 [Candidatus Nomurabacteria bacterium]|nr:hypothetical protein [Candidatus Nomurabacteria bacterium]
MKKWFILLFLVNVFVWSPISGASAQNASAIVLESEPALPIPGEPVTVTASSLTINTEQLIFVWYVGNSIVGSGAGVSEITFKAPPLGSTQTVKMLATTPSGVRIERQMIIVSGSVDILWQANTYTPPFYKGRALPSRGATVQVVAIPIIRGIRGQLDARDNFDYQWRLGGKNDQKQSGFGKDSFIAKDATFQENMLVEVEIATQDGVVAIRRQKRFSFVDPFVVIYKKSRSGVWSNRSGKTLQTPVGQSVDLVAMPFFFRSFPSGITFDWSSKGSALSDQDNNDQTLSVIANNEGKIDIDVSAHVPKALFQESSADISLQFLKSK